VNSYRRSWTKDVRYPGAGTLNERLKHALGGKEPSYHAAQAYAGVITAADILKRARDMNPESIQNALRETNLTTAYGPIRFTDFRGYKNQNPVKMVAEQIQHAKFITVFPKEAAAGKILPPRHGANDKESRRVRGSRP
jgi:branched-chain amino acid transport system substrate-binding protein